MNKFKNIIKDNIVKIACTSFLIGLIAPVIFFASAKITYPDAINGTFKAEELGPIGDFLAGTMTPFLTIAAFLMLIKTYFLQKEELRQNREEMQRTAEALTQQKKIMEEEQKVLSIKSDIETFNELFNVYKTMFVNNHAICRINLINMEWINYDDYNKYVFSLRDFSEVFSKMYNINENYMPVYQIKLESFLEQNPHIREELKRTFKSYFYDIIIGAGILLKHIDAMQSKDKELFLISIFASKIPEYGMKFLFFYYEFFSERDSEFYKMSTKYHDILFRKVIADMKR